MAKSQQGGQNKQPSGNGGGTGIGGKMKGGAGDGVKSAGPQQGKTVIKSKF